MRLGPAQLAAAQPAAPRQDGEDEGGTGERERGRGGRGGLQQGRVLFSHRQSQEGFAAAPRPWRLDRSVEADLFGIWDDPSQAQGFCSQNNGNSPHHDKTTGFPAHIGFSGSPTLIPRITFLTSLTAAPGGFTGSPTLLTTDVNTTDRPTPAAH
eukprot:4966850-Prymnesium_polylepis.1